MVRESYRKRREGCAEIQVRRCLREQAKILRKARRRVLKGSVLPALLQEQSFDMGVFLFRDRELRPV